MFIARRAICIDTAIDSIYRIEAVILEQRGIPGVWRLDWGARFWVVSRLIIPEVEYVRAAPRIHHGPVPSGREAAPNPHDLHSLLHFNIASNNIAQPVSCASRPWHRSSPSAATYDPEIIPVMPGPFLAPSTPSRPPPSMLYIPTEPLITLNPQLAHHRSPLHPHLDWDAAKSPLDANLQHGSAQFAIGNYQLGQYASMPPVKSLALTFAGAAASNLGHWGTIHVQRRDGRPLCVGDVLNAISVHLTRRLKWEEIQGMEPDKWERVVGAFNRRVCAAMGGENSRMQRLDFLDGQTLFDGIQFVGGELRLSLL
ncbi:hypothetical protein B0H17DRAFT_1139989 [Mycena rosella]|uniref:DUF6699 domain-containing protein n=1 Tax=Mycena rosella TaxID=1033263 RepID=A0AAD7D2W1_MYCRO|nr:hypothetical protein B0H17DRAFT_1139989 [Mycena rosella]